MHVVYQRCRRIKQGGAKNENMSMVKMVTRKTVPKGCFLGGGVIFSKNAYGLNGNTQDSAYLIAHLLVFPLWTVMLFYITDVFN